MLDRNRIATVAKAGVLTFVESASRGVVSLLLISFASFYSVEEYAALLPLVACQQLICALAPFGADQTISRLMNQGRAGMAAQLYRYLPRYICLNLLFAIPIAWILATAGTRDGFSGPPLPGAILIILTSAWLTIQRSRQQVIVLTGNTARFSFLRTAYGLTHLGASLVLALLDTPYIYAFFGGQAVALFITELIPTMSGEAQKSSPRSLYKELFSHGWVFGIWSIFGWFSGYGATILLTHVTTPVEVARYGQCIAFVSLIGIGLGSAATAIQANLLKRQAKWSDAIQRKTDRLYDTSIVIAAAGALIATAIQPEQWVLLRQIVSLWPSYVWGYFFVTYASMTLYQRVMLRYQYDPHVSLSWLAVCVSDVLALGAFAIALHVDVNRPLWASAALFAARFITIYAFAKPHGRTGWASKLTTLTSAGALAAVVVSFSILR